jgi:hypothetical protein
MRAVWYALGIVAATTLVLAGCAHTDPSKPPKAPEEYAVPPEEDSRFSQPPNYPKNTLNPDRVPTTGPGAASPGSPGSSGPNRSATNPRGY